MPSDATGSILPDITPPAAFDDLSAALGNSGAPACTFSDMTIAASGVISHPITIPLSEANKVVVPVIHKVVILFAYIAAALLLLKGGASQL